MNLPHIAMALAMLAALVGLLVATAVVPVAPFAGGAVILLALAVIAR